MQMQKYMCTNCNKFGHMHKTCKEPICSWGIILINNNKFLLISRKHSIGYSDFIRGIYELDNMEYVTNLFKQMMFDEIDKIKKLSFSELWNDLLGALSLDTTSKEYIASEQKYNNLINGINGVSLSYFTTNIRSLYTTQEWGFPKGRRKRNENDLICAKREFFEETSLSESDISIISHDPYTESFTGTNGRLYKHIYYLAISVTNIIPNIIGNAEIGNIGYFTYDEALLLIRNYHVERKQILKDIYYKYINKN